MRDKGKASTVDLLRGYIESPNGTLGDRAGGLHGECGRHMRQIVQNEGIKAIKTLRSE